MTSESARIVFPPLMLMDQGKPISREQAEQLAEIMRNRDAQLVVMPTDAIVYQLIDGKWEPLGRPARGQAPVPGGLIKMAGVEPSGYSHRDYVPMDRPRSPRREAGFWSRFGRFLGLR